MQLASLPDLVRPSRLLSALSSGGLLVLLLALAPGSEWKAAQFIAAEFAALWTALSIAVTLGVLSRRLPPLPLPANAVVVAVVSLLVALLALSALYLLDRYNQGHMIAHALSLPAFAGRGAILAMLLSLILVRYLSVVDSWQAQVHAAAQAQFEALQARIRPHFLFNSMNTIAALIAVRPRQAEEAVLDLSDLFRAALGSDQGPATLEQELELVRRYLAIEALRLGDKLKVTYALPDPLPPIQLPRLLLQPLAENAVLHGIGQLPQGGALTITVREKEGGTEIELTNPCPPPAPRPSHSAMHAGHALGSVRGRLTHFFGPRASVEAGPNAEGYGVRLFLPKLSPLSRS